MSSNFSAGSDGAIYRDTSRSSTRTFPAAARMKRAREYRSVSACVCVCFIRAFTRSSYASRRPRKAPCVCVCARANKRRQFAIRNFAPARRERDPEVARIMPMVVYGAELTPSRISGHICEPQSVTQTDQNEHRSRCRARNIERHLDLHLPVFYYRLPREISPRISTANDVAPLGGDSPPARETRSPTSKLLRECCDFDRTA